VTASRRRTAVTREVDLYPPVKAFLERQRFVVKGEIGGCDVVAVRGDEPPVIVELKLRFTLGLVLQAIDRLRVSETVYVAVCAAGLQRRGVRPLCRRLGLGLLLVHGPAGVVEVAVEPGPYRPRQDRRRAVRLLAEHHPPRGRPDARGATLVPIMTAYRQESLRIAAAWPRDPRRSRRLRRSAEAPKRRRILARIPTAGSSASSAAPTAFVASRRTRGRQTPPPGRRTARPAAAGATGGRCHGAAPPGIAPSLRPPRRAARTGAAGRGRRTMGTPQVPGAERRPSRGVTNPTRPARVTARPPMTGDPRPWPPSLPPSPS